MVQRVGSSNADYSLELSVSDSVIKRHIADTFPDSITDSSPVQFLFNLVEIFWHCFQFVCLCFCYRTTTHVVDLRKERLETFLEILKQETIVESDIEEAFAYLDDSDQANLIERWHQDLSNKGDWIVAILREKSRAVFILSSYINQ